MQELNSLNALDSIDRQFLTTNEAAHFLNRQPQTLRNWATTNRGPIKCVRLAGRLVWPTDAIRALIATAAADLAALNSEVLENSRQ